MILWTGVNVFLFFVGLAFLVVAKVKDRSENYESLFLFLIGFVVIVVSVLSTVVELIAWKWF